MHVSIAGTLGAAAADLSDRRFPLESLACKNKQKFKVVLYQEARA